MTKTTLRKTSGWTAVILVAIIISLTLFGRSVGERPLPWHLAWLGAFGKQGWEKGFELSYRDGWSKKQVREALGAPVLVAAHGVMYSPGKIDLDQWRASEVWFYPSPFSKYGGITVAFEKGFVKRR